MKKKPRSGLVLALLIVALFLPLNKLSAQKISGYVFGYSVKTLKLSRKDPSFSGCISGVRVSVLEGSETISTQVTNASGRYSISIPKPGNYRIVFSKNGYAMVSAAIQAQNDGTKRVLNELFVVLKKGGKEAVFCGTFKFESAVISFKQADFGKSKEDIGPTNVGLFKKAIKANASYPRRYGTQTVIKKVKSAASTVYKDSLLDAKKRLLELEERNKNAEKALNRLNLLSEGNLDVKGRSELEAFLESATAELEGQDTSSIAYKSLKAQIALAEMRISDQEKLVVLQQKEVDQANTNLTYLGLFAGVMALCLVILVFFIIQRRKFNKTLQHKNAEIQSTNKKMVSSIKYASLIQSNFLSGADHIKTLFSDSFIYYKPKDIVSGDFYWLGEIDNKKIIVASDCTGHGVPGAMLTVLGHSALNTIILEKKITSPKDIVSALNEKLMKTFAADAMTFNAHGMDLSVVSINNLTGMAEICGAVNGVYAIQKNELRYYDATYKSLGDPIENSELITHTVELDKGDMLFMFSDGYQDQFKGGTQTIETYNLDRFEKLLVSLADQNMLSGANATLDKEFTNWKQNREQVDDVLVVGIKI